MASYISKAFRWLLDQATVQKASRGSLSSYVMNAMPSYGQPQVTQTGDAIALITPDRQREVIIKTPTAAACINTILDYAGGVDIKVRNRDASKAVPAAQRRLVMEYLTKPNPEQIWRTFEQKLLRDIATLGYGAIEIERNATGGVANLWILDAARLRIDFDEHGTKLGFDMLDIRGMPIIGPDRVHAWLTKDVIYFQRDAQSQSDYPISRTTQLFSCAVLEALMLQFISNRFTDSNIPYGILDLGDITEMEQKAAIAIWNEQMEQLGINKLMLTGSRGGMKFTPFGEPLDKMHAKDLLLQVRSQIMAVLGVTVNELGETADVNKSNGFNLSYTFKKRAVEPVLDTLFGTLTSRLLWDELGLTDLELYRDEIDSRDELLQSQIDKLCMDAGVWSINHVRNRKGLPNVPGGDECYVLMGTNAVPVKLLDQFAQTQLDALQAEIDVLKVQAAQAKQAMKLAAQAAAAGAPPAPAPPLKGPATPPMVRDAGPDEKFTTVGGAGSSTTKFKLPKPNASTKPPPTAPAATPARGPVEQAKQVGHRKD